MSENIQILNEQILNEAKGLMKDRFPMMVKYFLEDTEMYLGEIQQAIKTNEIENAVSPAHTIKSSSKQLGAEKLSEIAKEMEAFTRDAKNNAEDIETLNNLLKDMSNEFKLVISELENYSKE